MQQSSPFKQLTIYFTAIAAVLRGNDRAATKTYQFLTSTIYMNRRFCTPGLIYHWRKVMLITIWLRRENDSFQNMVRIWIFFQSCFGSSSFELPKAPRYNFHQQNQTYLRMALPVCTAWLSRWNSGRKWLNYLRAIFSIIFRFLPASLLHGPFLLALYKLERKRRKEKRIHIAQPTSWVACSFLLWMWYPTLWVLLLFLATYVPKWD